MLNPMDFIAGRTFHSDYRADLLAPFVINPFKTTFVERSGDAIIVHTIHQNGAEYYSLILLKPLRWMEMDKDDPILPTDELVGYTYYEDGPLGIAGTLEWCKKRLPKKDQPTGSLGTDAPQTTPSIELANTISG